MDKCWANGYSTCSNKLSKEHLVSGSIFEQQNIYVSGFPWCKDELKMVSVASITSKILCTKHNNALSEIDKEGINAVRVFEMLIPERMKSTNKRPLNDVIDGYNFERWLLKTAVNLSVESNFHIGVGMNDSIPGLPSPYILAVIFGELKLSHCMGLYVLENSIPLKFQPGSITVIPIHKDGCIGGYYFHIRGFNFVLSIFPGHPVPSMRSLGFGDTSVFPAELLDSEPKYRSSSLHVCDLGLSQATVKFSWACL